MLMDLHDFAAPIHLVDKIIDRAGELFYKADFTDQFIPWWIFVVLLDVSSGNSSLIRRIHLVLASVVSAMLERVINLLSRVLSPVRDLVRSLGSVIGVFSNVGALIYQCVLSRMWWVSSGVFALHQMLDPDEQCVVDGGFHRLHFVLRPLVRSSQFLLSFLPGPYQFGHEAMESVTHAECRLWTILQVLFGYVLEPFWQIISWTVEKLISTQPALLADSVGTGTWCNLYDTLAPWVTRRHLWFLETLVSNHWPPFFEQEVCFWITCSLGLLPVLWARPARVRSCGTAMITICWLLCVFLCNVVYSMENPHHEITTVSAETCRGELVMPWQQKPNNILAIDGGGVRGFVAAMILEKIEETMGKPIHEIFDLICGTSTGGLIALAAGMNKISMKEIKELYRTQSKDLFTMYGAWEMVSKGMYDPAGMERLVQRLGGNKTMDPANKGGTNVCVVASFFDKVSSPKPFVIKNYMWEDTVSTQPWLCNTTAAEAAYCTSAAPMIFPPRVKYNSNFLYDGGLVANNPTSIAIEEVMGSAPVGTVVSIGTGSAPPRESYTTPLSAITSTVAADSARVHEQVARRASTAHLHENTKWMKYFRLNPELAKEFDLTDADEESFASMEKSVHEFLETAIIDASAGSILAKPVVRPGPLTDRTSLLYKALEGEAYVLEDSKQTPDS